MSDAGIFDGGSGFVWATGIEDTFIAQEEPSRRRLDEYELTQHYRFWREDVDLAASIGFRAMRYGIPWYRVEPEPGRFDWSFTDCVLPYLFERGIEPIVDLMHYGTPLWLEGSFLSPEYPERVARYAGEVARRYGGLRYFTPLNEPFVNAELCGRLALWPPYGVGDRGWTGVMHSICKGIVQTVEELRRVRPDAVMVHVEAIGCGFTEEPALRERLELDMARELAMFDLVSGHVGRTHPLGPYLMANGLHRADLEWFEDRAIDLDVVGLNYYPFMSVWRRWTAKDGETHQEPVWGGGEYLSRIVRDYHQRYHRPIVITECSFNERAARGRAFATPPYASISEPDSTRRLWLEEALTTIQAIRSEGLPLAGFVWWPLFDLINWEYRQGADPVERYLEPMGLVALRMDEEGVFRREPLPISDRMREIIHAGDPR